jgi:ABC-type multidrug transport system ATPase subunit
MIGKSTLLKMIANNLYKSKDHVVGGSVSITGVSPAKDVVWSNLVSFIDQIDRLHPFLTVFETCKFAWLCRAGGTHRKSFFGQGEEIDETIKKMDDELYLINRILDAVGLTRVKDTFVGGEGAVRGVSGGEKKRVTFAEMLCIQSPVYCCDEISTGLDGMFISCDYNSGVLSFLCPPLTVRFSISFSCDNL